MKKLILFLLLFIGLIGCQNDDKNQSQIQSLKEEAMALNIKYEALEEDFKVLQADLIDRNTSLVEMKDQVDILQKTINHYLSFSSVDYKVYLESYAVDGIKALENYEEVQGYIVGLEDNQLTLDLIEHVSYGDQARIDALNVDTSKPIISGGYLHDLGIRKSYEMTDNFKLFLYDWEDDLQLIEISKDLYKKDYMDSRRLFKVDIIQGKIFRITEIFLN